jgi:hypothetical protein
MVVGPYKTYPGGATQSGIPPTNFTTKNMF